MAKTEKVTFSAPVYKDQTVLANYGKLIEVGDTLVVATAGDGGVNDGAVSLTLTHVSNGGKTVGWSQLAANYRTTDIKRTHKKHQFTRPTVPTDYVSASNPVGPITGITIDGVVTAITSLTVTSGHAADLKAIIDGILGENGYSTVTWNDIATDTFTIEIFGTTKVPNSINNNGTPVAFNVV